MMQTEALELNLFWLSLAWLGLRQWDTLIGLSQLRLTLELRWSQSNPNHMAETWDTDKKKENDEVGGDVTSITEPLQVSPNNENEKLITSRNMSWVFTMHQALHINYILCSQQL